MLTLAPSPLPSTAGSQLPHVPDRDNHPTRGHHLGHRPLAPHRVPHVPPSTRCFPRPLWDPLLQAVPALLSVPQPGLDPCSHVSTQTLCRVRCPEPSYSTVSHVLTPHHSPLPLSAPLIPSTAAQPPSPRPCPSCGHLPSAGLSSSFTLFRLQPQSSQDSEPVEGKQCPRPYLPVISPPFLLCLSIHTLSTPSNPVP